MAQSGRPSIAHVFNDMDACIYCDMYRVNVVQMAHACKGWRELVVDQQESKKAGISLAEYRRNLNPEQKKELDDKVAKERKAGDDKKKEEEKPKPAPARQLVPRPEVTSG